MQCGFKQYHPLVNFLFFALVIGFSIALSHPLSQGISLVSALAFSLQTQGKKAANFAWKTCFPLFFFTFLLNPAFSHQGNTILLYFSSGNPLTLESVVYGFVAGMGLCSYLLWFFNFSFVITTDKFIYLFGKILPALSLVLSMTLRFIPKFKARIHETVQGQKSLGRDLSEGSLWQRTKIAVRVLSIVITWSLENAIETADSMKSRGYGLKGRSAFSIYRLEERDKIALGFLTFCGIFLLAGAIGRAFGFVSFPSIRYVGINPVTLFFQLVYFALCIMPTALNLIEEKKWKAIHSTK